MGSTPSRSRQHFLGMKSPDYDQEEAPDHYGAGAFSLRDVVKMWPVDLGFTFQQVGEQVKYLKPQIFRACQKQ